MKVELIVCEEQRQHRVRNWLKEHKGVIIAGSCLAVATIAGIVIYKRLSHPALAIPLGQLENVKASDLGAVQSAITGAGMQKASVSAVEMSQGPLSKINGGEMFVVSKHIRNLSGERCPSEEKIRTAIENGFKLGPHQTWVEQYTKNLVA